jgi:hypothetical protein
MEALCAAKEKLIKRCINNAVVNNRNLTDTEQYAIDLLKSDIDEFREDAEKLAKRLIGRVNKAEPILLGQTSDTNLLK